MKTIMSKTLAIMFGLIAFFSLQSCEKDDDKPSIEKTLTGGPWQMTAMTSNPPIDWFGTPVTDVYAQLPACIKDDLTVFKTNGTVNFDEGGSKCEQGNPQTESGTWALNTDETIVSVTRDGETESWDITSLKGNSFEVDYQTNIDGLTYKFSVVFKRK
jgi:hypothetical protein